MTLLSASESFRRLTALAGPCRWRCLLRASRFQFADAVHHDSLVRCQGNLRECFAFVGDDANAVIGALIDGVRGHGLGSFEAVELKILTEHQADRSILRTMSMPSRVNPRWRRGLRTSGGNGEQANGQCSQGIGNFRNALKAHGFPVQLTFWRFPAPDQSGKSLLGLKIHTQSHVQEHQGTKPKQPRRLKFEMLGSIGQPHGIGHHGEDMR